MSYHALLLELALVLSYSYMILLYFVDQINQRHQYHEYLETTCDTFIIFDNIYLCLLVLLNARKSIALKKYV